MVSGVQYTTAPAGPQKAPVLSVLARKGLVNELIVDEATARRMLNEYSLENRENLR